jgi:hypothetical protein
VVLPEVQPGVMALMRLALACAPGELPLRQELDAIIAAVGYLAQNHPLDQATLTAMGEEVPGAQPRPVGVSKERTPLTQIQGWTYNLVEWIRDSIRQATEGQHFHIRTSMKPQSVSAEDDEQITIAVHLLQLSAFRRRREGDSAPAMALGESVWGIAAYMGKKYTLTPNEELVKGAGGRSQAHLWRYIFELMAREFKPLFPELVGELASLQHDSGRIMALVRQGEFAAVRGYSLPSGASFAPLTYMLSNGILLA